MYIGVVAFTARSTFSIVVSTAEATTTLQDSVPVRASVAQRRYNYYRFNNPAAGASLEVSVTVFSGDADLTVSTSPTPTLYNGSWVSISTGGDTIAIPSADAGWHYIGVYGFTNASYSVVAHVASPNQTMHLVSGVPQVCQRALSPTSLSLSLSLASLSSADRCALSVTATGALLCRCVLQSGTVNARDWVYYSLSVDTLSTVSFTVTAVSGRVSMFANKCTLQESQCGDRRPTNSSHTWTASDSFSSQSITIFASDPNACSQCSYVIGVMGVRAANFTIVAVVANSSSTVTLLVRALSLAESRRRRVP
jgi:hypothetical protein